MNVRDRRRRFRWKASCVLTSATEPWHRESAPSTAAADAITPAATTKRITADFSGRANWTHTEASDYTHRAFAASKVATA
jgi:hypothetical protein